MRERLQKASARTAAEKISVVSGTARLPLSESDSLLAAANSEGRRQPGVRRSIDEGGATRLAAINRWPLSRQLVFIDSRDRLPDRAPVNPNRRIGLQKDD